MQNVNRPCNALRLASIATILAIVSATAAPRATAAGAETRLQVAQAEKPSGQGTVNKIDAAARKLNITHGPIAALKWPGMTMDFGVASGVDLGAVKPGAKIGFTLGRGSDGMYVIDAVKPTE